MAKDTLCTMLHIDFAIKEPKWYSLSKSPYLVFKDSNCELSRREIKRAMMRPYHLKLDNNNVYRREEDRAIPKNGEDILEVVYMHTNNDLT